MIHTNLELVVIYASYTTIVVVNASPTSPPVFKWSCGPMDICIQGRDYCDITNYPPSCERCNSDVCNRQTVPDQCEQACQKVNNQESPPFDKLSGQSKLIPSPVTILPTWTLPTVVVLSSVVVILIILLAVVGIKYRRKLRHEKIKIPPVQETFQDSGRSYCHI